MAQTLDTFRANIPAQALGTKIYYYISATSNSGKTSTKPLTAPAGYLKFAIDNPTSINSITSEPGKFTLSQNYPNPFNPVTRLDYSIPVQGFVSLKVYDALGKEVASLVNEKKNTGLYEVEFNGSGLSSGIYFYTLTADNFTETKRMILLK